MNHSICQMPNAYTLCQLPIPYLGWGATSEVFVLRLMSDNASANGRMIHSFMTPEMPPNGLLLAKTCDQYLG